MKKLLAVLMSLSLLVPAISEAQNNSQQNRGQNRGRPATGAPNRSGTRPQTGRPGGRGSRPAAAQTSRQRPPAARRGPVRGAGAARGPHANQFRHRGRYFNRIRGPAFVWPRGFGYRRWAVGGILPSVFLASPYFFTGWAGLGLQAPGPGFQWVRYGPDLVLVNLRTGQIVDVIHDAFF